MELQKVSNFLIMNEVFVKLADEKFSGNLWERERKILPSSKIHDKRVDDYKIEKWFLSQFLKERYNNKETFVIIFGITELPMFQNYSTIFEVVENIKHKKNIKLSFINDYDLHDHETWDREEQFVLALQNIEQHRLEFVLNNTLTYTKFKTKFPNATVMFGSRFLHRFFEMVEPFEDYTGERNKHFLCLNSRITKHRDEIFDKLQALNNSHLSYRLKNIFLDESSPWNEQQKRYFEKLPELIASENGHYAPDPNHYWATYQDVVDKKYYKDSCVYVCTESLFAGIDDETGNIFPCTHWWTEKLLKSFYYKLPVIQVGLSYSLESARSLGFKTFDKFWSESYDWKSDPKQRMSMILEAIDKLSNMSIHELNDMYYSKDMQDILNHNHNLLFSLRDKYKSS